MTPLRPDSSTLVRTAFSGRRVSLEVHDVSGGIPQPRLYEIARVSDAVAVLPVYADGSVVLVSQHRFAVGERLVEAVAGLLEGERDDPLSRAKAELAEEAGLTAEEWRSWGTLYSSPGVLTERLHVFVAKRLTVLPSASPEAAEVAAGLRATRYWPEELREMLSRGDVRDAKTYAMLSWYLLNRQSEI